MNTNVMKVVQLLSFTCLALVISMSALAQNKRVLEADVEFDNGGFHEAADLYKKAYATIDDIDEKGRVLFRIGECHRLMTDNAGAEEWYEKSITAQYYKENEDVLYNYAEVLREQGKFDEAIVQYRKYMDKGGDKSKANQRIRDCEDAALMVDEPPTRYIVEPQVLLNTPFFDYGAVFASKKQNEVVVSSSRQSATGSTEDPKTGESFMDLFTAKRDKKGKWSTPTPLPNTINTPSNEGAACYDSDAKTIYFTRCKYDKKSRFACDIYEARKQGTNYADPQLIPIVERDCDECNDSSQVGHPALTPDDKHMIFASDMPGGYGGKDLWYISYDKKSKSWSRAKNLGEKINTNGDEMFPYVHMDGSLFFASNGHAGLGGLDIFKAESIADLTWDNVEAMKYPINSSSDDFGIVYEKGKDQGFFTSNRPGGKGKDDIYSFKMPPLEFCLKATVYDYDTGVPIPDSKVVVQGTDGSSYELTSDGNGGISLCDGQIIAETNYSVDVSKTGYIGTGDQFSTVGLTESTTFAREYFLKEIVIEKEYDLPLVLYPFDQATLLVNAEVNSKDSLEYLVDLLDRNPTFVIQLEAHTDSRGKDNYNLDLSQRRAETCVNYLITRGIDAPRLKPVGMGETSPLIKEAEINAMGTEEEQEAAHQVNRRTVFKIISYDYTPPSDN